MKDTKKILLVAAVVIAAIAGILYVSGVFTNDTFEPDGVATCKNPGTIGVRFGGNMYIDDTGLSVLGVRLDVQPSLTKVSVDSVSTFNSYSIGIEDFDYEVCAIDTKTNSQVGECFKGNSQLTTDDKTTKLLPWTLSLKMKDLNCNGQPDETFYFNIAAKISGSDIGENSQANKLLCVKNGVMGC